MNINAVNSALSNLTTSADSASVQSMNPFGDGFGSLIKSAVESIDSTQRSAEQEISRAVTGDAPDLHRTIIELQSADLKFQFGLQVRNKLIGAYEEIMRMQV